MQDGIVFDFLSEDQQADIKDLMEILDADKEEIIYKLKRIWRCQQEGGERLALLSELAAIYTRSGEEGVSPRLGELLKLLKSGSTEVDALQMIIQQAAQHQRLALLNELAKIYLNEGEEAVTPRLGELVALLKEGSTEIRALEMVKQQANQFETTFWMYFKRLEEYIENNDDDDIFFDVDGDKILVVNPWIDKNLWIWWYRQSRFVEDNSYAVIAFEMGEGSSFYDAMDSVSKDSHSTKTRLNKPMRSSVMRGIRDYMIKEMAMWEMVLVQMI